ncbi:hypothetical protein G6F37_011518 [Rhizopus arrhizus]|nr:hypothetical protein G6F38_011549 [Rhizopus arrhizus]KAG1148932.1 hypothetical protein G6F37_011518 [Rhizopus arrhizus]
MLDKPFNFNVNVQNISTTILGTGVNLVTSTPSNLDVPMVSKTSTWRAGHCPGSVFIDMTGRKELKIEFLHLVAQQYPSRVGVLTQQVGTLNIIFADKSTVLHCRVLDIHMQIIRLRLSNLPFLNEKDMMKGLEKSLRKYGDILDVRILLEPTTDGQENVYTEQGTKVFDPMEDILTQVIDPNIVLGLLPPKVSI